MDKCIKVVFTDGECKYFTGANANYVLNGGCITIYNDKANFLITIWEKVKYIEIMEGGEVQAVNLHEKFRESYK